MKLHYSLLICLVLGVCSSSPAIDGRQASSLPAKTATAPLRNEDVLEMLKTGLSPEIVAAKIGNANCSFDTTVRELENMKAIGTPDLVLLAMVRAPAAQSVPKPISNLARAESFR
jgi:hypothetical protein